MKILKFIQIFLKIISDEQIKTLKANGILFRKCSGLQRTSFNKNKIKNLIDDEKMKIIKRQLVETDIFMLSLEYNISDIKDLNNITNKISKLVYKNKPDSSIIYTKFSKF